MPILKKISTRMPVPAKSTPPPKSVISPWGEQERCTREAGLEDKDLQFQTWCQHKDCMKRQHIPGYAKIKDTTYSNYNGGKK